MTRQQQKLLAFIREYIARNTIPPTYDEMRLALGLASKSGIHCLVVSLEARGYITRLPDRARSIKLVDADLPDNVVRNLIPVDPVTYQRAVCKAAEAGMTLTDFAATALNSLGARR